MLTNRLMPGRGKGDLAGCVVNVSLKSNFFLLLFNLIFIILNLLAYLKAVNIYIF